MPPHSALTSPLQVQCCVWFAAVLGPAMLVLGLVMLVRCERPECAT